MTEEKGKLGQSTSPFPFSPFLLISKPEVETIDRMYVYQKGHKNTFVQIATAVARTKYMLV